MFMVYLPVLYINILYDRFSVAVIIAAIIIRYPLGHGYIYRCNGIIYIGIYRFRKTFRR